METLFRGRFDVRVDDKGRFRMPTALRNSHSPKDTKNNQLLVTNNLVQGQRCLDIYTQSAWLRLENRIARLPNLKAEVQAFQRFYLSGAQLMEYDKNGRVLMPPSLRKYAGLDTNIILVGMGEKIEVWSKSIWDQLYEGLASGFEETLQAVAQLDSKDKE